MSRANRSQFERDTEAAELERMSQQAKLSKQQMAALFDVSLSTVLTWHSGRSAIPKAVLMAMRLRLHMDLPPPFDRWHIEGGKLHAPSGKALTPNDILALVAMRDDDAIYQGLMQRLAGSAP